MKVEIFTLCDAATESGSKLNILGSFDTLFVVNEPIIHPACAVALKIRFSRIETGQHSLKISFVDMDGKKVMPDIEGPLNVKIKSGDETATANLIMNIQGLRLPGFGEYSIDLAIDGREEGSLPLYVKKIDKPEINQTPQS
jgi:hypothetical protein